MQFLISLNWPSEIIKNTFLNQGLGFTNDAFESILEPLSTDSTLLPNFQFLISQLILNKNPDVSNENQKVNINDINDLGGLSYCIQKFFDSTYQSLNRVEKSKFEKINKALYSFEIENDGKYETIEKISEISGLTSKKYQKLFFDSRRLLKNHLK